MKAHLLIFARGLVRALLFLIPIAGALIPSKLSGQSNPGSDVEWKTLMEVAGVGYAKVDNGRSYQFFPLNADQQPLNNEQSHEYMFEWDFGDGIFSLEAFPIMTFDRRPPKDVTLMVTAIKETDDPYAQGRLTRPRFENCTVTDTFTQELNLRKGDVIRDEYRPNIQILGSGFQPVPGTCINYLVKIELPSKCKFRSRIEIAANLQDIGPAMVTLPNQFQIRNIVVGEDMEIVRRNNGSAVLEIKPGKNVTHYALLKCRVSETAALTNRVNWTVRGNFEPVRNQSTCAQATLTATLSENLAGSLDPSSLHSLNKPRIRTGEMSEWHIRLQNDGTTGEKTIRVVDTLPAGLDFDRLETTKVLWNNREMDARFNVNPSTRVVKWTLHVRNDADALQPGEVADIYFKVPVVAEWPCPEGCKFGCPAQPTETVHHRAWVNFMHEYRPNGIETWHQLNCTDLKVECKEAKKIKILTGRIHRHCFLKFIVATAGIAVAAFTADRLNETHNWW